eukprot:951789-Amorphochlora_amoeboformis.AAC.2
MTEGVSIESPWDSRVVNGIPSENPRNPRNPRRSYGMSANVEGKAEPADKKAAPRRRKRKSRWGQKADTDAKDNTPGVKTEEGAEGNMKRKRKSRFGKAQSKVNRFMGVSVPANVALQVQLPPQLAALASQQNLTADQTKMMLLKLQLQEVRTKLMNSSQYVDKVSHGTIHYIVVE